MKIISFFVFFSLLIIAYFFFSCSQTKTPSREKKIAQLLVTQVDSFSTVCNLLQNAVEKNNSEKKLQDLFLQTRLSYKRFEWAAEYFEPATSRFVNGPPVQEIELSGQVLEPSGLQVIEGILFPYYNTSNKPELIKQLTFLQARCKKYKTHFSNIDIFDWQIFDAIKLEVFRIETLGITGFDNPLTLNSSQESLASLQSIKKVVTNYDASDTENLNTEFNVAIKYLSKNTDFNSLNRAEFIIKFCNSISTDITVLSKKLNLHFTAYNRLLNQDAKTLFDTNAFNVNAYSPDQSSFVTTQKIALGKKLFSDPVLSENNIRSCQSCHQPDKAFTDGLIKNTIISSNKVLRRNTPTLLNAALQSAQFYDMRVNTLENQSLDVVQSSVEMHGSMKLSVKKLWNDSTYKKMFSNAFTKKNRNNIDTLEIMNAIGSYIRSLVYLNSRFDEYMRGDKVAMNADEVNGFNIFMGKAKCATCHYMPLFNGTFAPRYMETDAEVIGVPQAINKNIVDFDLGRYDVIKIESLKHAFKTPTIRNAARTAPYMHNGVFSNLTQVVDFYKKGGGTGLGLEINNQTLSFDKLNLTQKESSDLIAFIKTLNSKY